MSTNENKKQPLTQKEAEMRKLLLLGEDGKTYSVNYDLTLVIRRSTDKIEGEKHDFEGYIDISLTFTPKDNTKDKSLFLNFVGEIHSLIINSKKVEKFKYEKHQLYIDLSLLVKGENKISIIYSGDYNHSGVGLHHYIDPIDKKEYLYTQFEPYDCNRLLPCFDQPDIKAVLKLKVIAPKEWIVLANAYEKSILDYIDNKPLESFSEEIISHLIKAHDITKKNYHLYIFEDTPRISTYLYALCAGPFYCYENKMEAPTKLRLFMRESLKDYGEPQEIFRVTIAGMKFYSDYFGFPFPFNKYDQIFCPEYNMGAMENVGLITLNEFYCWKDTPTTRRRAGFAITILHELAHMWFGDMVTMKWWDNLWLNESFATFISHLCMAKSQDLNKDYETSWILFADYKGYAYSADQMVTTHPVMGEIKDTEEAETEFDEIVYEKGSSMVKQMYYYIGDETFSKGLKKYFQQYKWDNTVFEDFIGKMVECSDNKLNDLKELCQNWFQKAGLNEISLSIEKDESTNKIKKFVVKQNPCLKDFPNRIKHIVDFLFIYDFNDISKNKIIKRQVIEAKEETTFDFSKEDYPLYVFLNYNDYGYMKMLINKEEAPKIKEIILRFNEPLVKLTLYRSLFDALRDSKISSIEYLDILIDAIKLEKDDNNLSLILRHIRSAIITYTPRKYVAQYKTKLFKIIKELIEEELSEINYKNDIVKILITYLTLFAYNIDEVKYLIQLLNLSPKVVSQENRFSMVSAIYKNREIKLEDKKKLLENEVKRDKNSDNSILAKHTCNALTPDKINKEKLWRKIVNEPTSDSLVNMQAIIESFATLDQLDLVEDFLKNKYFEVVPILGKTAEVFYIKSFISDLSPTYYTEDDTIIEKFKKLIEEVKDMPQVKRYVTEEYDLFLRKRKAHALCEEYLQNKK